MQSNQSKLLLTKIVSSFVIKKLRIVYVVIVSSLLYSACSNSNEKEQQIESYLSHLKELNEQLKNRMKASSAQPNHTFVEAKNKHQKMTDLEELRLPSSRFRRFPRLEAPQLNFRQFMSISDCALSRHIAFRNSPLGRMMLPAQELAYNHRFLKAANQCDGQLDPKLDEQLKKVIKFKQKQWPSLHWNAVWGGTPFAKFFSLSWPRGYKIKSFDTLDEAQLAWLAKLSPQYKDKLSTELEQKLAQLPSYVGGQVLMNAYYAWFFLSRSQKELVEISRRSAEFNNSDTGLCKAYEQGMQVFKEAQMGMSTAYQQLETLQKSLKPLINLKQGVYPSPKFHSFIKRYLDLDHPQSIRIEFKRLIKEQVNLWLKIQKFLKC